MALATLLRLALSTLLDDDDWMSKYAVVSVENARQTAAEGGLVCFEPLIMRFELVPPKLKTQTEYSKLAELSGQVPKSESRGSKCRAGYRKAKCPQGRCQHLWGHPLSPLYCPDTGGTDLIC